MLDEHMKGIAKRHARKDENQFYRYLRWCGWENSQIAEMWKYAQKGGEKNGESV